MYRRIWNSRVSDIFHLTSGLIEMSISFTVSAEKNLFVLSAQVAFDFQSGNIVQNASSRNTWLIEYWPKHYIALGNYEYCCVRHLPAFSHIFKVSALCSFPQLCHTLIEKLVEKPVESWIRTGILSKLEPTAIKRVYRNQKKLPQRFDCW